VECFLLNLLKVWDFRSQHHMSFILKTASSKCLVHLFSLSCSRKRVWQIWLVVYVCFSVVLKKTKSAEESLSLFLAGTENEASGRKSGVRRFTHTASPPNSATEYSATSPLFFWEAASVDVQMVLQICNYYNAYKYVNRQEQCIFVVPLCIFIM